MSNVTKEKAKTIVGISISTNNNEAADTIPPLWGKFFGEATANRISAKVSDDVYAVYTSFENEHGCKYGRKKTSAKRFFVILKSTAPLVKSASMSVQVRLGSLVIQQLYLCFCRQNQSIHSVFRGNMGPGHR